MGNLTLLRLFGINHHLPFNATRLPSNSWHIVSAPSALSLREVATLGAIKLLCYWSADTLSLCMGERCDNKMHRCWYDDGCGGLGEIRKDTGRSDVYTAVLLPNKFEEIAIPQHRWRGRREGLKVANRSGDGVQIKWCTVRGRPRRTGLSWGSCALLLEAVEGGFQHHNNIAEGGSMECDGVGGESKIWMYQEGQMIDVTHWDWWQWRRVERITLAKEQHAWKEYTLSDRESARDRGTNNIERIHTVNRNIVAWKSCLVSFFPA